MTIDKIIAITAASMISLACACSQKGPEDTPDPEPQPQPEVVDADGYAFTTTADKSKLFACEALHYGKGGSMSPNIVKFTDERFQTVDGFGAALTVSSCYLMLKMNEADRTALLTELFSKEKGIGSSLARIAIGGCDFSWDNGESGYTSDGRYTWCDEKGIENFSAHPMDVKYVVPILQEALKINPDLKIIGSPWSAPRWMKLDKNLSGAHNQWTGGRLNPEYYEDYAKYFVEWIEYFKSVGVDIYAVTPQNEPLHDGNSMSMLMPWTDCRDFIKTALGPAFEKAGLKTKILIFDHNYNYDNHSDQKEYPLKVFADAQASKYIAGSAWHSYGGNVNELDKIEAAAPDKEIYFTEASIGTWNYDFAACLMNDFRDIMLGTLSRGCKGVTLWNWALTEDHKPYTLAGGSCTTCYGAVSIQNNRVSVRNTHYYNIAHCSKVIRPGAVRIGTTGLKKSGIEYQAYRNPDGTTGVVILNNNSSEQEFVFDNGEHTVKYTIPRKAIGSVIF